MRRTNVVLRRLLATAGWAALAGLIGCGSEQQRPAPEPDQYARIELSSTAFAQGQPIPQQYTGEGADLSPPLSWSAPPEGTRELALICDDPDAPAGTWTHWVLYRIPATVTELPEGLGKTALHEGELAGVVEGKNSFGSTGYGGPMPPPGDGPHRYFFRLYALDNRPELQSGADRETLLEAAEGHILAVGQLMGTYER